MKIGGQLGLRFDPGWNNGNARDRLPMYNVRPYLEGNLFREWLQWRMKWSMETDQVFLLDGFIDIAR